MRAFDLMPSRSRLVLRGSVAALVVVGALGAAFWLGAPQQPESMDLQTRPTTAVDMASREAGLSLPMTSAQAVADGGADGDAGDGDVPRVVMEPEVLAPPWNHLGRTARYEGMRDGALVGKVSVLVGCRKVRVLGDGEPRDLAITLAPPDAGEDRRCLDVAGSDDTRLFFFAGMRLFAFDMSTGAIVWSVEHDPDGGRVWQQDGCAVVVAGPVVAVASARGRVVAFDRVTGATTWTLEAADKADPSERAVTKMVAAGDRIFTMRRALYPQAADGNAGWQVVTDDGSETTPKKTRALVTADVVRSVEAATGHVTWTAALSAADGTAALGADLAANDKVVALVTTSLRASQAPPEILLLDAATATLRARSPIPAPANGYSDVFRDELTFTEGGGLYLRRSMQLARIDEATGAFRWTVDDAETRPLFARGALFVAADQAILRALDPATGAVVWSYGFAALRAPEGSRSAALGPPRRLAAPGPGGGDMVAAFAQSSNDGIKASGQGTLFAPVTDAVVRRDTLIETSMIDDKGKPVYEAPSSFLVLGQHLGCPRNDHRFRAQLRGNGTVAIAAEAFGTGADIADQVIDLDRNRPVFRLVFHSIFVGQGCR